MQVASGQDTHAWADANEILAALAGPSLLGPELRAYPGQGHEVSRG